jgi:DNA-binding PadR family transcriptional regulator
MSTVFSHGRLRLYLLKLLADSPRHGYELIRLLEDRFMGLYAPSAGTIYPRLQRLEADGLVTLSRQGGRKVYAITPAGREELARRGGELDQVEAEIRDSVRGLAQDIATEVRGVARDVTEELRRARQGRRQRRPGRPGHQPWEQSGGWPPDWTGEWGEGPGGERLLPRLREMAWQVAAAARANRPTEAQLRECMAILEDAFSRIGAVLRDRDHHPPS